MEKSIETREFAVMWKSTNSRAIPQLPKLCNILHIVSEDPQTAAEIACFKLSEMITAQFPSFLCKILADANEPYFIKIDIFDKDCENGEERFVGKIYGLEVIE